MSVVSGCLSPADVSQGHVNVSLDAVTWTGSGFPVRRGELHRVHLMSFFASVSILHPSLHLLCAPLFMSGSRPLFFWLNNWLEARPAEGGKCWIKKGRGILETYSIHTLQSGSFTVKMVIKDSFPHFSSDSPLTRQSGFPPLPSPPSFHVIQVYFLISPRTFLSFFS